MERAFEKAIEAIRKSVIEMGTLAEEAVSEATTAFLSADATRAEKVIERDSRINSLEMTNDKAVFEYLALRQPVASDLRFLFIVQKMNKDLERLGDHAVNIAQAAIAYASQKHPLHQGQLPSMATIARQMLHDALTAFINNDGQLALKVLEQDDQVDELNRVMTRSAIELVKQDITGIEAALEMIKVTKNLERIADLATNIAEDVIFYAEARDVKHHGSDGGVGGGE